MNKWMKAGLVFVVFLAAILSSVPIKVSASGELFTLGPLPTVNHEVASTNVANVSNITQYIDAVNNQSIDTINFTTNITASTTGQAMGLTVSRDLRINGNGFTLTITGNASFGPAGGGSAGGTHLVLSGTGGTLHLQNLTLNRSTVGSGQNDFMSIMTSSNQTWDIIFDNFTSSFSSNTWRSVTRTAASTVNSARIFLRNNVTINLTSGSTVFATNGTVVTEPNSTVLLVTRSTNAIAGNVGGDTKLYIGSGSQTTLGLPPQIWTGNRGALLSVSEINVYSGSSLNLVGTGNATTPALTSLDSTTPMVFRVDSDATLKVENTAGPAIISSGSFPIRILGNSNSTLEIYGNGANTTTQMTTANSAITLVSPKYYNIQNNGTGSAFTGINVSTPTFSISGSNIGVWALGSNIAGLPTTPSPFANVTLVTGSQGLLTGSSAILASMPGGWNTASYRRLAFVELVKIDADDVTMGLARTHNIGATITPEDAIVTYTSQNTNIATVDANGIITAVGAGQTTITINGTKESVIPGTKVIQVTVTNNVPVLTVPAFTEVALNGEFDPTTGVSASDIEDGDLIDEIVINNPVDITKSGVYVVNYSVTDFNQNTVTANQVVVVKDDSVVIGNQTIIKASDFSKRPSQVVIEDEAIKTAANVRVYDKTTGLLLSDEPVTVDSGTYSQALGIYPITFTVTRDLAATISIEAQVKTGSDPTLIVPSITEIAVGSSFNPEYQVSASDEEDGDLTEDIVIEENTVNVNEVGVYRVRYSVTDLDGNRVEATQIVAVHDGELKIGDHTILYAVDFTKRVSQVDTSSAAILVASQARVYDKATGDLLPSAIVNVVNLGGYHAVVGQYDIILQVAGDVQSLKTIKATVVTGQLPVLTVPELRTTPVGTPFDVLTGVSATDNEDGVITNKISVVGDFDVNIPGVYRLQYTVVDSDGNRVSKEGNILVDDGTFTVGDDVIIQAQDFTKRISQVDTSDQAVKEAAFVKLYDLIEGNEIENPNITVVSLGGYQGVAGVYIIAFAATDDPAATISIEATVESGEHPVLTVPAFTEVELNGSFNPLTGVSATDDEDGIITGDIDVTNPVNVSQAGVYVVHYSIKDNDGNVSTATQTVLVQDGFFTVGDDHILYARDFEKRPSEVDLSEVAILAAANVRVFNKTTGDELTVEDVRIADLGGYQAVVNTYNIRFEVINDASTTKTIQARVVTGNAPVLTVPTLTEISLNDAFDPMTGVSATDLEDGTITNLIRVTGTVDPSTVGVYTLHYEVTDRDGNTANASQIVSVTNGESVVGDQFILVASSFTKRVGQVDPSDAAILVAANIRIYDRETGVELTNEQAFVVNNGNYSAAVNVYPITIQAVNDATATITITAQVVTGEHPTITVPGFVEVPLNGVFNPMSGVSAADNEDGDLTYKVQVSNTVNVNQAGVYVVGYSVTDSDGNTTTISQTILVKDDSFVVGNTTLIQAQDFSKRPSQVTVSELAVKAAAQVKVYDKASGQMLNNEPVSVNLGSYSDNVGAYPIHFSVTNDSTANIEITASVVAGEVPALVVPTFSEVSVNGTFDPMQGVTANDTEDGLITNLVSVTNPVNVSKVGVYVVSYMITDLDGNTVTAQQTVLVNDDSFVIGDSTLIQAQGFSKRPSQVVVDDAIIKSTAQVKVYDKVSGQLLTNEPLTINIGSYGPVVGDHPIQFIVTRDPVASISVIASVVTGSKPILVVDPSFVEVGIGELFNAMEGVTATDTEDGDITTFVTIEGTVDTAVAGVYVLTYHSVDKDGNETTKNRVVMVQDNRFVVGDRTLIQAQDFSKRPSEVVVDDATIKVAANVKVYDKATGQLLPNEPVTVDKGNYKAAVGTYPIAFSVTSDPLASIIIEATVQTGSIPVLTVPSITEIAVGGSFNPRDNVSALDQEDGDLTGSISIEENTVNTSTIGVYKVRYSVIDLDGNRVEAKQIVVVHNGEMVIGNQTILHAIDFTKRVGQVDLSSAAIIEATQARVYDKNTGDLLPNATVNVANLGGYHAAVGTYPITLEVAGDTGARKTIQASVITGAFPTLTVPAFREVPAGLAYDPMTGVTAVDDEDGVLTHKVTVVGEFDVNVPGVYTLQYNVVDSDGNKVSMEGIILVNDDTFVLGNDVIIQAQNFKKRISEVDQSNTAVIDAAFVKLYDRVTGKEIENPNITVVSLGGYQGIAGVYTITFAATDDVTATISVQATVIPGEFPTLVVPAFTEVTLNGTFNPLTGVSATDNEDGIITNDIEVTNPVNVNQSGVYTVRYSIKDSDGNISTATQTVLVQDGFFAVGDEHILHATNFNRRISEVDLSEVAIFDAANVRVFNKITGQELTVADVKIADLGGYQAVVDTYNIRFEVINDASTTNTIVATVVSGQAPELLVPNLTEVNLNDAFDPMTGVSAIDLEDGDITNLIRVTGNVDVNTVGVYHLDYEVTDRDGNHVHAVQVVVVTDGEMVIGDQFILSATSFTKRVGQVDTNDATILSASQARIYDKFTGLELTDEPIRVINQGGYHAEVGIYPITIEAQNDPKARMVFTATVVTGEKPIITVNPSFLELTVGSAFNPLTGVTATDAEDGDITSNVQVVGQVDTSQPGVYTISYDVVDSDMNLTSETRVVLVKSDQFVVGNETIIEATDFTKRVGEVDLTPSIIKLSAQVKVYDKVTGDLLANEPVNLTNLGGYKPVVGSYPIELQVARDTMARITIQANVVTGERPILTVPNFTELQVNETFDPLAGVSAIDTEDGDITSSIQLSGVVDTSKAGIYVLTYQVTDSDSNLVQLSQTVLVNDGRYGVGQETLIEARSFTKRTTTVSMNETEIKTAADVRVFDKGTGVELTDKVVQIADLGGYGPYVGVYNITFNVVSDPQATVVAQATVVSDTAPELMVPRFTELKVGEPFDAMSEVKALDKEDGDITALVSVTGQVQVKVAGIYELVYQVQDSDGNKVEAHQTVLVNDGSFAYDNFKIIQALDFRLGVSQFPIQDETLKSMGHVRVYDVERQEWITLPIISVDRGGLTNRAGRYLVSFRYNPTISVWVEVYQDLPDTGLTTIYPTLGFSLLSLGFMIYVLPKRKKESKDSDTK